jgi:hypothetical protein
VKQRTGEVLAEHFNWRVSLRLADELVALLEVVRLETLPRQAARVTRTPREANKTDIHRQMDKRITKQINR